MSAHDGEFIQLIDGSHQHFYKHEVPQIEVIAHSLGMQARFRGHIKKFYSVAEHACFVGALMREHLGGDWFEGLIHDNAEAKTGDMSSPYKRHLPDFKAWEHDVETTFRAHYGFPSNISPECKLADNVAVLIEAHWLTPDGGACFSGAWVDEGRKIIKDKKLLTFPLACLPWNRAAGLYMSNWEKADGKARVEKAQRQAVDR